MFWFQTIKNIQEDIFYLGEKIAELRKELRAVDTMEIERLKSHMISLRGLVNRKAGKFLEEEEEEEKKDPRDKVLVPVKE